MKILKKIYNLLPRTRVRQIPMIIVLMIIGAGFEVLGVGLVIPLLELLSNTDESLIGLDFRNIGSLNQEEVIILCLTIFASVYVIKGLYLSFLLWLFGRYTFNTKAEISNNLMESYMSAQYEFHLENNSAQLIRNLTIECNQLASFALIPLLTILTEGFMMLSIVIFLIWLEPLGTLFVMVTVIPLSFIFQKVLAGYSTELGRARQKADGFVIQKSQEALGGIKDAKVLNKTDYFVESFCQQNLKSAFFSGKQFWIGQLPRIYLETISVIILSIFVYGFAITKGNVAQVIPTLSAFTLAAFKLLPSANRILSASNSLKFAEPVIEALSNPLGLFRNTDDYAKNNYKRLSFEKNIEVKNICYKYPNSDDFALSDVSFNIQKGESIGVVGKSGAGKSTFADIFLGLLKPQSGKIYTDGVDIYNDLYSWQKKVGYVQQDIFLLDESIRKNIAFGCTENEIDDDKLNQVIMESQLEEFVSSLAEGLNTKLGERGVRLSGGQKQRFGIARALYHDSPILVFDEATSALDGETEKEIVYAIENLKGVRTIIVIAHRLSTIKSCNRVVELDEGKLKNIR